MYIYIIINICILFIYTEYRYNILKYQIKFTLCNLNIHFLYKIYIYIYFINKVYRINDYFNIIIIMIDIIHNIRSIMIAWNWTIIAFNLSTP